MCQGRKRIKGNFIVPYCNFQATCYNDGNNQIDRLQGGVQLPTGGTVRERFSA